MHVANQVQCLLSQRASSLTQAASASRSPNFSTFRTVIPLVLLILVSSVARAQSTPVAQYAYDPDGRLIQVIAANGSSTIYQYDAAGNILSVQNVAAGQLALAGTTTTGGETGGQVVIQGSGFSTTLSSDVVKFDGVAATVLSATANQLVVQIPSGAGNGLVSVTVNGQTVNSVQSFSVYPIPAISGFSPSPANFGATVTVTGTNFVGSVPNVTLVSVGPTHVANTSASATQVTFVAAESGFISVVTPNGQGTSATPLLVLPSYLTTADVLSSAVMVPNGASQSLSIGQAGYYGMYSFNATQGQYLSLIVNSLSTVPSGASVGYSLYSPSEVLLAQGSVSTSPSADLPQIPVTGTYLLLISSSSATVQMNATLQINTNLPLTGTTIPVSTSLTGEDTRVTFNATAGEDVGLGLTGLTLTPPISGEPYFYYFIYGPTGAELTYNNCYTSTPGAGCTISLLNLSAGTYSVRFVPSATQTMSFNLTSSQNYGGALALNTPQNVSLVSGQGTAFTFTATAGQTVAVNASSIVTSPATQNVTMTVYNASGTSVGSTSGTGSIETLNLTELAAGTYSVVIVPSNGVTATMQVTLASGVGPTLPMNGTTGSYATTEPGENAYFYFSGTAGEDVGFGVTGLTLSPTTYSYLYYYVYGPTGSYFTYSTCSTGSPGGGCQISLLNLASTGTYTIELAPIAQQTMSFNLTGSKNLAGTLALNTPQNVSLVSGQDTQLTFTATAGETVAVSATSIVTNPASQNVSLAVYNASGTSVGSATGAASSVTANLPNLAAGTYTVVIVPANGASATMQVTLAAGISPTLSMNGSTSSYATTVPAQDAYFYFSGTAGEDVGFGVTGLTLSPTTYSYLYYYVYGPTGGYFTYNTCSVGSPGGGCQIRLLNLASTGTYTVELAPIAQQTMSFNLTGSKNLAGSLALNTAQGVTLVSGQGTELTFSATAGETVAVSATSIVTNPASQNVSLAVYNASGTVVGSATAATSNVTVNLPNLAAGTYTVVIAPLYGATATMQVIVAAGVTPTLSLNGTTGSYSTTDPGENAYLYFSGTAGEDVGFGLTGLTLSPTISGDTYVLYYVYGPTGTELAYNYCYISSPGEGCQISLLNLPTTGTYFVELVPFAQQTMSFNFTASQNLAGTLALNTPQSVNLLSGQDTALTFTATAGETVAVSATSIVTAPSGQTVTLNVYNASGTSMGTASGTASSETVNLANLAAGTYTVVIVPTYGATASMQVTLASSVGSALSLNGSTSAYTTTVPGQIAYFTLSGTAGQNIGIGVTGLVLTPSSPTTAYLYIYKPGSTSAWLGAYCYPTNPGGDCQLSVLNLPSTGTYTVEVLPTGQQTMSFSITASQNVAGTLALNTPQNVTLVSGQNTALTFTATAGETVTVNANSIVTTPSGQSVTLTVYNSSGTSVGSTSGTGDVTVNLPGLAAGTYTVVIVPSYGASATMSVTLASAVGATLSLNGSTGSYATTVPGQIAYFPFSGTAGEDIGIGVSGLVLTPSSPTTAYLYLFKPGSTSAWLGAYCYPTNPGGGCQLGTLNLPSTGTYTIEMVPTGQQTMSFNLTASQNLTGTLALNTPQNITLVPGQNTALTFTATAGQSLSVVASSIVTSPAGQDVTVTVYNSSGTSVGATTGTGTVTVSLTSLPAGTYTIVIVPYYGASATMQVTI
jgi:YD repeat-containing protein